MTTPSSSRAAAHVLALCLVGTTSACAIDRGTTAQLTDEHDHAPADGDRSAPSAASEGDVAHDASPDAAPKGPTYASDVRPILTRACVSCHSEGSVAPFSLDTYETAKPRAAAVAAATAARTMPPTGVDNSGACNTFRDTPYLSDDEIATLAAWAKQGAPEGDASKPAPAGPALPQLTGDVRTVKTPSYTPSTARADDYRCFVIESPFDEPTFVTGFDTHPGTEAAHHMVVFYPFDDLTAGLAQMKDALEDGPGYTCFGTPGIPATVLAAWTPGSGATLYPDQTGIQVVPRRPLIVQMHYNTAHTHGSGGADSTRIAFSVKKDGITPAAFINLIDLEMDLPPGKKEVDEVFTRTMQGMRPNITKPVQILGVYPHMHELGYRQILNITGADQNEACMVDVPRYEFNWQRMYMFERAITVQPSDLLKLTCKFDTTSRTSATRWGEGTQDEMCVMGLLVKQ